MSKTETFVEMSFG